MFDGRVWLNFCSDTYANFLCNLFCYLLSMNVDWFQPFTHTEYSLGAIYMTVHNLPCNLRYCQENVILIGIIPGPSEPSISLNSYLTPLVEELKIGWLSGFMIHDKHGNALKAHVALSCLHVISQPVEKYVGFFPIMLQKVAINV